MDSLTLIIFIAYFLIVLVIGLVAGKKKNDTAEEYFLAGRKLPWYAVGLSMVGSNISTEHFIGMVGAAYLYGIAPANWDLTAFIPLSILIFFFLPYYFRKKLYTIPQFLEQRYNKYTRTIFAGLSIIHLTIVILAGALYAGGLIFQEIFYPEHIAATESGEISSSLLIGILIIAVTTGIYSIYGGLSSVVWTDVFQVVVLLIAGVVVVVLATNEAGGIAQVWQTNLKAGGDRLHLIKPANDGFAPWTGVATLWITLGIWYNCTNQFYIQRCFGAKDEWHARMGILLNGFMKFLMPTLIVFPGVVAFGIYGEGVREDRIFMSLVQDFLPPFMVSIVLTGMAAAIMSTVSSVLNSASTIFTIDFYQRFINEDASQDKMVRIGRLATLVALAVGLMCAPFILLFGEGLFVYIQEMAGFFAPPMAVLFVMAILWKKSNSMAANTTLIVGFLFGIFLKVLTTIWVTDPDLFVVPFLNRALLNFVFCQVLFIVLSLWKPMKQTLADSIIWNSSYARLPQQESLKYTGFKNFILWWSIVLVLRVFAYIIFW